ncbi:MAG: phytanoyl-CoA dioxygenase [Asticcacaulis sp.]|uniref:phytanoyl-CoA dioxygenase n=1 Tax=Asticcacaulis sp. TaxID=1872648 RepID=UPI0039E3534F
MATFAERLQTRVPNWQRFFERAREDARNPAYDLLPVLGLDQRNAFSKTLAAFSPKTPGFKLNARQADLHDQLGRDGLTSLQAPLPADVLADMLAWFKSIPVHDPYRAHLGTFVWDRPPTEETNIGYYSWEEVLRAPHMIALMNNPDILAVAEAYLGCKPVIDNIGAAWGYPGRDTAKGVQRFHRDYDCSRCFKAFYYLTDIDTTSGPHKYVKGSHQDRRLESGKAQTDDAIIEAFGAEAIETITAPAGSWFLEDVYGFHKGQLPVDRPRLLLAIEYNLYPSPLSPKAPLMAREPLYDPYINKLFLK